MKATGMAINMRTKILCSHIDSHTGGLHSSSLLYTHFTLRCLLCVFETCGRVSPQGNPVALQRCCIHGESHYINWASTMSPII